MEVPSEVLPKLVCENCDGYLSRGPVHLMDSVRYRCGRCLPSEGKQGTRIEAYEELAKLMTFPCRYQHNGCPSKVPFMGNEAHEEACLFRKNICPIAESGKCEWTGIHTQLLEHCRQDHADNVVENPCKFTHNITRSSLHNYLLWTLGVLFLIQTKVCTATRKIYHSVRLISDPARASNYKYTLCIENKDSRFYKDGQVAPRGRLALQNDSSIQTDINGLRTMLADCTGTTFTVTIESAGNGTTVESSTAESSSQGSSSANTRNKTPVKTLEPRVQCAECKDQTEPVYRRGWLCWSHAPTRHPCRRTTDGCPYSDVRSKLKKHEKYLCHYKYCRCTEDDTVLMLDEIDRRRDITHRAGIVYTVTPVNEEQELCIVNDNVCNDNVVCTYKLHNSDFILSLYTPMLSEQLYKYRCAVDISHPDTGHTLTCIPIVVYDKAYDWRVRIPRTDFYTYSQFHEVNIKINITKMEDPSEYIL